MVFTSEALLKYLRSGIKSKKVFSVWSLTLRKSKFLHGLGVTDKMDDYEKRKLKVFNQLNILQFIVSCLLPLAGLIQGEWQSPADSAVLMLPPFVSLVVLYLNSLGKVEVAQVLYFFLYPVITSMIFLGGMDLGLELHFILYGILSVFFLSNQGMMLFALGLSMISYFVLFILIHNYNYHLAEHNRILFLLNEVLAILMIFYALILIKRENTIYQFSILSKSRIVHKKNLEIYRKNREIAQKAKLLEQQTSELKELNAIKDKFFSVIAHDLKTPIYALRNVIRQAVEHNVPAREIKLLLPDILNDLNYTTDLMENLLLWARNQIRSEKIRPKVLEISELMEDVIKLMRLQAKTKKIYLENQTSRGIYAVADRDMINLVLRNLISNAIKFTPENGAVTVGALEKENEVQVYVKDTGQGMTENIIEKIQANEYFSTRGTANESGTGFGLMLCKECIDRSGGTISIESLPGAGSKFSFTLPRGL
jgi:signal transduction histidine kinase